MCLWILGGPAVHLQSLSAARKASPDPGWSSHSSSLAIRRQEGISGPSGPAIHLYSPSAARKASLDPGWSSRSSSLAIRRQAGVSGPRVVRHRSKWRLKREAVQPVFCFDRSWSNLEQTARNMRTNVTTRRWDFWAHVVIVCLRYGNKSLIDDIDFIFCPIPCFCCALLQYVFLFFQKQIGRKGRSQNNLSFLGDVSLSITIFGHAVVSQLTHICLVLILHFIYKFRIQNHAIVWYKAYSSCQMQLFGIIFL